MSEYSPLIEDDENIFILKRTTNIFKKDEFMLTKDNKVLCKFKKNSSKIKFNFNCKNITFNQKFKYFEGKKIFCIFLKNPVYGIVYFNELGMISIYFKHKGKGFHSINENYNSKRNITILDEDNVAKFKTSTSKLEASSPEAITSSSSRLTFSKVNSAHVCSSIVLKELNETPSADGSTSTR